MPLAHAISARGTVLDTAPDAFGPMQESNDLLADTPALRQRLAEDGYLFLRGLLDRSLVLDARRVMCERLAERGDLNPAAPLMDAVAAPGSEVKFAPELADDNPPLMRLLYDPQGPMMRTYQRLLGGPVRHYDYTWVRAVSPGIGTHPHQDVVYMGRGCTDRLFTSWTPLGDIDLEMGGLIVMERSHGIEKINRHYGQKDVDGWCVNRLDGQGQPRRQTGTFGWLTENPRRLRNTLDRRWLTCPDYRAGDVVIFSVYAIHGGLDNHSRSIRLSADSRYQPTDQPVDDRWVSINGQKPVGHGEKARRELIC